MEFQQLLRSQCPASCVFGINKLLLNFSTTSTAVFGAYFKLQTFVYMAIFGLNNALIPIVAFNLGAKHTGRIKRVIRLSGAYSALIGLVGLIIMEMFSLGVTALRILGLSFVFGGVLLVVLIMTVKKKIKSAKERRRKKRVQKKRLKEEGKKDEE